MELNLNNKVALVAASSTGLGLETALHLSLEGAKVIITSRSKEKLQKAASHIESRSNREPDYFPCDLTLKDQRETLISSILQKHKKVDILITNSGGPPTGPFVDFSEADWLSAFQLNFISIQSLISKLIGPMKQSGWGRIVNITSISAKQPIDGLILSNAVRAAVLGMAKTLSNELASFGVTVNNVCPGYTLTDRVKDLAGSLALQRGVSEEEVYRAWEDSIPMKRLGKPEELASLICYLCSEQASYITGTTIQCDGGAIKSLF
ncbi:MAG: SDR family oxidoreductase [Spirochaetota bacterium]|nr:SDR family oxidoreductase [Spirochaetota bacterium]